MPQQQDGWPVDEKEDCIHVIIVIYILQDKVGIIITGY